LVDVPLASHIFNVAAGTGKTTDALANVAKAVRAGSTTCSH
jgi:hypothetical protein